MFEYVRIEPEWREDAQNPYRIGTRVRIRDGHFAEGLRGTVVGWGRSTKADHRFAVIIAEAKDGGRELTSDDHECLIDEEGPVVDFDNGETDWFPGQAITAVEPI